MIPHAEAAPCGASPPAETSADHKGLCAGREDSDNGMELGVNRPPGPHGTITA
ncbi:hypothetical protein Stsp02_46780 [Streptomyces sp. NBRC 14336]|nr:hypothetical protein Stsp02_46780 [Streptomyces sp. NBRC 14336]